MEAEINLGQLCCHIGWLETGRSFYDAATDRAENALKGFLRGKLIRYEHYSEKAPTAIRGCRDGDALHCSCEVY